MLLNACLMQVTMISNLLVSPQRGKFDARVERPSIHLRNFKWIRSIWIEAILLNDILTLTVGEFLHYGMESRRDYSNTLKCA